VSHPLRLAVMQPYFLPYIGYFQLIAAADLFVVYDNIKYTKKGWINRNRMLQNGTDAVFTLPLQQASDYLNVVERELAAEFDRNKLLQKIKGAYLRAPHFSSTYPLLEEIIRNRSNNLFEYILYSITRTCEHMGIATAIRKSSEISIDHSLKSQDKVLAICAALGADTYVNPIGGTELYSRETFEEHGIALQFLKTLPHEYPQLGNAFVPALSILDVLMFNSVDEIRERMLGNFEMI